MFNEDWVSYGQTVAYRDYAAARTAKLGGLASLVRSVTPYSIYSPHTGWQDYQQGEQNFDSNKKSPANSVFDHLWSLKFDKISTIKLSILSTTHNCSI